MEEFKRAYHTRRTRDLYGALHEQVHPGSALEIAELRLETEEELREWREKRRKGRVKVKLDHEQYVDLGKVVEVRNI